MQEDCFRLTVYKAPFPVTLQGEECSKYKVFWEQVFKDEKGRRYEKINRICTYRSVEEMESDICGFLCFVEYLEELDLDSEVSEHDETDL